jgi:hypothetical protein
MKNLNVTINFNLDNEKWIWFDCDGTWIDLYGVEGWLDMLINKDATPYAIAKPLVNLTWFARTIHELQNKGIKIGIISWLSKGSCGNYDKLVTQAKIEWLKIHLPSVEFNEIKIVAYGTPKHEICSGILFDDSQVIRELWGEGAYEPCEILEFLRGLE